MIVFRRICTACRKPIDWAEDRGYFHKGDGTHLCEEASVDLEVKETSNEPKSEPTV